MRVSQSAASQHVNSLEHALGAELIDRSVAPVLITLAGITKDVLKRRLMHKLDFLPKNSIEFD